MEQTPRSRAVAIATQERKAIPEGLWLRCPSCKELTFIRELERNVKVCPHCRYHYPLSRSERVSLLVQPDSFHTFAQDIGCLCGIGAFGEQPAAIAVVNVEPDEGVVALQKVYTALAPFVCSAVEARLPLVLFHALDAHLDSTGAPGLPGIRFHHMLRELSDRRLPYLLILTDAESSQNYRAPFPFGDVTCVEGIRTSRPAPKPGEKADGDAPSPHDTYIDFFAPRTEIARKCESLLLFFASNGKEYGKRSSR